MTKQYAIDLAKKLNRDNERSYFVVNDESPEDYRVVDKEEKIKDNLNRYVVFSIEVD